LSMIVAIVEEVVVIEKSTTLDLRRRLGDLVKRVALRHDEFMIERKGKSLAAMVPVQKLQQLERLARCDFLIPLPRRTALPQEEADALADEAKHRSRKGPVMLTEPKQLPSVIGTQHLSDQSRP